MSRELTKKTTKVDKFLFSVEINGMEKLLRNATKLFSSWQDLSLLFIRIALAYGFFGPAIQKINNFDNIIAWFENGLKLPMPELLAYLATGSEALGVVLLTLGLATRLICVPLLVTMGVAITLVHGFDVFSCADKGYEIALYYALMLLVLLSHGAGRISLDETFLKKVFGS